MFEKKPVPANPTYNYMFYDGTWQKPVQNTYWLHNNTNILRANATKYISCLISINNIMIYVKFKKFNNDF